MNHDCNILLSCLSIFPPARFWSSASRSWFWALGKLSFSDWGISQAQGFWGLIPSIPSAMSTTDNGYAAFFYQQILTCRPCILEECHGCWSAGAGHWLASQQSLCSPWHPRRKRQKHPDERIQRLNLWDARMRCVWSTLLRQSKGLCRPRRHGLSHPLPRWQGVLHRHDRPLRLLAREWLWLHPLRSARTQDWDVLPWAKISQVFPSTQAR